MVEGVVKRHYDDFCYPAASRPTIGLVYDVCGLLTLGLSVYGVLFTSTDGEVPVPSPDMSEVRGRQAVWSNSVRTVG